ncbi:MAG: flavodoxin domain-containing protein [Candidatus Marinimicrobia bacterium]|nr:flavodoxin domain-containing protein [Candidatus Neomarinimicrobiota bacterium]
MNRIFISLAILLTTAFAGGKNSTMKSILIVYGSYSGSTAEIATRMKTTLDNLNCKTVLMPASAVQTDLTQYDLIVIGSAIHGNKPHENVIKFIDVNRSALSKKKVAVFAVCSTITSVKEKRKANALTYPDKIANGLKPIDRAVFGGNFPSSGRFANYMGKLILGIMPGDYRDWNKIAAWATSLARK